MKKTDLIIALSLFFYSSVSFCGEADVIKVDVKKNNNHVYDFVVTVAHKDAGWKHYANKWEVIGKDGIIFGTRVLHHPHDDEQPFTRRLSGVGIPENVRKVTIRAHDLVHKYGGKTMDVKLP